MKSFGLVALAVSSSLCIGFGLEAQALDFGASNLIAQATAAPAEAKTVDTETATTAPEPAPVDTGEVSTEAPHLATPAVNQAEGEQYSGFRQFLEDQQNAHDKLIVDRFLLGVAVLFACIAAALLFSLPPKRREQKE